MSNELIARRLLNVAERYAKLARAHITKTGNTAKSIWTMLNKQEPQQEVAEEEIAHTG